MRTSQYEQYHLRGPVVFGGTESVIPVTTRAWTCIAREPISSSTGSRWVMRWLFNIGYTHSLRGQNQKQQSITAPGRTNTQCSRARCAVDFGFNPKWFKPHGVRKSVPTILRAAGGDDDGDILVYGRWKQVPTSLIYQGSSTTNKNRLLCQVCNETLLTEDDIRLSRLLPSSKGQNQLPQVRRFWSHGSW